METDIAKQSNSICRRFGGALKALVATAAIALAGTALADSYTDPGTGIKWYYEIMETEELGYHAFLYRGNNQPAVEGATGEVVVPATLNGYAVKRIGQYAFYGCSNITKVTLPDNLTYIGHHAFAGCSKLAKVILGNKVTEIDCLAFNNCSKLNNISLPTSLTKLGYSAFQNCSGLTSIEVPSGVTAIEQYTFYGCSSLKTAKLPYGVTTIGKNVFSGCSQLETVFLPIGFINNSTLMSTAFPNPSPTLQIRFCGTMRDGYHTWYYQVIKEGSGYYAELRNLQDLRPAVSPTTSDSIAIPSSIGGYTLKGVGQYAFYQCRSMKSVTFPNTVTNIGYMAFGSCSGLTTLEIPNTVKGIGRFAFYSCSELESVSFGLSSTATMAYQAFDHCGKLREVTLPKSQLGNIMDAKVFTKCADNLAIFYMNGSSVDLTTHVMAQIKDNQAWYFRFYNPDLHSVQLVSPGKVAAKQTGKVTIPSTFTDGTETYTVKSLDTSVFSESGVTDVTIPNTVTNIGDRAFYKCASLTKVTIGSAVQSIGSYAFEQCTGLVDVYVPDSVTELGPYAFRGCTALKTVSLPGGLYNAFGANTWFANCGSDDLQITYRGLTHRVTFNATTGTIALSDRARDVAHGAAVGALPTPNPPSGYSFTGWFTAQSGGTRITKDHIIDADVTFYAHYTQTPCTVTFNANGGNVSPTTLLVVKGNTVGTLPMPTRGGYTFDGWWTTAGGGSRISATTIVNANVTYYAHWLQNFTVTFNANGGTVSPTTRTVVGGSAIGTLPVPTRNNHTFGGWWTTASGSGTQISDATIVSASATYYARWTLNTVTVTFNANGGTVSPETRIVGIGTAVGELPEPTRADHEFEGWWTMADDGAKISATTVVNEDVTYFAHWKERFLSETVGGYTWYYVIEGAGTAKIFKEYGSRAIEPAPSGSITIPSKLGGMDVTGIGGDAFYNCGGITEIVIPATVSTIASSAFLNCSGLTDLVLPDGLTTIYASAFQGCSGLTTVTIPASLTEIGNYAFLNCTGLRTVTFVGNCPTAPTETGKMIYEGTSATLLETIVSATASGWDSALTAGKWQNRNIRAAAHTVTVTFDPRGGTVSPTTKDVVYGGTYGVLPTPNLPNQNFQGWYTEMNGGTKVEPDTLVTSTTAVTLYAHWAQEQKFTVTFNANGGTPTTSKEYNENAALGTLPTVGWTNHDFQGWFTDPAGGSQISADTIVTKTITYYAHWQESGGGAVMHTITFYPNGGQCSKTSIQVQHGQKVGSQLPSATRTGYEFVGWKVTDIFWVDADTDVVEDIDCTACWSANTYSVTYNANGGTIFGNPTYAIPEIAYEEGTYPAYAPDQRTGWEFLGWFTSQTGGSKISDGDTFRETSNQTLFAHWQESVKHTVKFNANGGQCATTSIQVKHGERVGSLPSATRDGYKLDGWMIDAWNYVTPDTPVNSDITCTAKWDSLLYHVTYNANGGTIFDSTTFKAEIYYDSEYQDANPDWRDGWEFLGWFTAATGGMQVNAGDIYKQTSDQTLYAHWKKTGGGGGGGGGEGGGVDPETIDPFDPGDLPCYQVISPRDISDPIVVTKAESLWGALYYGCDVVGIVELKLGKPKKGETKVSGSVTMLDGKKCAIKAQKLALTLPTASALNLDVKKLGSMRIAIGSLGGRNVFSGSLGRMHVQTAKAAGNWTKSTATATVDASSVSMFPGKVFVEFLPDGEVASASNGKWTFKKAAAIKMKKGVLTGNADPAKPNLSGIKLTYKPKTGVFKGSFKVYTDLGGKLKKYTVKVTGVVADGVGHGQAVCKKPAVNWDVTVE